MLVTLACHARRHMCAGRVLRGRFLSAVALLAACTGLATLGHSAEPNRRLEQASFNSSLSIGRTSWALANLDGDQILDHATTSALGKLGSQFVYRVQLELSGKNVSSSFTIATENQWGINIIPRDVDGDHDLDLVISSGLAHEKVSVWINDGSGTFTQADPGLYSPSIWLDDVSILPIAAVRLVLVLNALDRRESTSEPGPSSCTTALPPEVEFPLAGDSFRFPAQSLPAHPSRGPPVAI